MITWQNPFEGLIRNRTKNTISKLDSQDIQIQILMENQLAYLAILDKNDNPTINANGIRLYNM